MVSWWHFPPKAWEIALDRDPRGGRPSTAKQSDMARPDMNRLRQSIKFAYIFFLIAATGIKLWKWQGSESAEALSGGSVSAKTPHGWLLHTLTPNGGADHPKRAICCRSCPFQPAAKTHARARRPTPPCSQGPIQCRLNSDKRSCIKPSAPFVHLCRPLWPCPRVL